MPKQIFVMELKLGDRDRSVFAKETPGLPSQSLSPAPATRLKS